MIVGNPMFRVIQSKGEFIRNVINHILYDLFFRITGNCDRCFNLPVR